MRAEAEITAGALLLFGRSEALRRFLPTHEAAFQVLRGLEVEVNDFLPYSQRLRIPPPQAGTFGPVGREVVPCVPGRSALIIKE